MRDFSINSAAPHIALGMRAPAAVYAEWKVKTRTDLSNFKWGSILLNGVFARFEGSGQV